MQSYYAIYIFILLVVSLTCHSKELEDGTVKDPKLISTFQVVRFPNDICIGTNSKNGTCYTSAECSEKDGTSSGSCADGFGVCCSFSINTCEQTATENITYWTQPTTVESGTCGLTVCPITEDICQLRLDFTTFVITGPNTLTTSSVRRKFAQPITAGADDGVFMGSNYATTCLLDSFSAQGASPSSNPPVVCGTLSGTHMYIEMDEDRCNRLEFYFLDMTQAIGISTTRGLGTLATRTWDITITQLECTNVNLPSPGCTQYFWDTPASGTGTGTITLSSYNFGTAGGGTVHLGNQHQRICIRRERGFCIGCFFAGAIDVNISGESGSQMNYAFTMGCCGYATTPGGDQSDAGLALLAGTGHANNSQFGFDCVVIPGAFGATADANGTPDAAQASTDITQTLNATPTAANFPVPFPPQMCGNGAGLGIGSDTTTNAAVAGDVDGVAVNISICTRHTPFTLEFLSDDLEGQGGAATNTEFSQTTQNTQNGFQIRHTQISC